ncbi:hypothetical protein ABMZ06_30970, partial [Pseudomonas aeruginosa]
PATQGSIFFVGHINIKTPPGGPPPPPPPPAPPPRPPPPPRRCQALDQEETLEGVGLRYLNRLSDLLFVAARAIARRQGVAEILWEAAAKPD